METFGSVMEENFPDHRSSVPLPFGRPETLQLVGKCGDGTSLISPASILHLKFFADANAVLNVDHDVLLLGRMVASSAKSVPFVGKVRNNLCGPFSYPTQDKHWRQQSQMQMEKIVSSFNATGLWWFTEGKRSETVAPRSELAAKLQLNPHFPVDELELLPERIEVEASQEDKFSAKSSTIEQITCTWTSTNCLVRYAKSVAPSLRSLKRVVVRSDANRQAGSVVEDLRQVFGTNGQVTAHTLILQAVRTDLVAAIVKAQFPGLSRLVLQRCTSINFTQLLPSVASNVFLEEFSFETGTVDSTAFELVRRCGHVSFTVKDLAVPPPKAAARLPCNPLQEPMNLTDFNSMCKAHREEQNGGGPPPPPLGFLTSYGKVVPLARQLVPRFQLLHDMLDKDDGDEDLVPLELEPPVSKESVALTMHFVTHYVPHEVHKQCVLAETKRGSSLGTEDFPAFSWCSEFAQFRTHHLQQRYSTSHRRVQVMCELMALAVFLNCASLKRFLRAALVMEKLETSERGKRNRNETYPER